MRRLLFTVVAGALIACGGPHRAAGPVNAEYEEQGRAPVGDEAVAATDGYGGPSEREFDGDAPAAPPPPPEAAPRVTGTRSEDRSVHRDGKKDHVRKSA